MKQETITAAVGAAYIRVSTDEQTELSPTAQLLSLIHILEAPISPSGPPDGMKERSPNLVPVSH